MKKYWKLPTVILASSMLISGGGVFFQNKDYLQKNNQSLLPVNSNLETDNIQVLNSVDDIKFQSTWISNTLFAVIKDTVKGDRLYGWGENNSGQLGINQKFPRTSLPMLVTSISNKGTITHVANSATFTLVILNGKELWAAGKNSYGEFGDGSETGESLVFKYCMTFADTVDSLSVGTNFAAATSAGKLYTWGRNHVWQLGNGSNTDNKLSPTQITNPTGKTWGVVKCGGSIAVASTVTSGVIDGLYSWGYNQQGELGNGTNYNADSPKLMAFSQWSKITNFQPSVSSIIITTYDAADATKQYRAYANGVNVNSQLGVSGNMNVPTEITTAPNEEIIKIGTSPTSTAFLTGSKELYTCGSKNIGQATPLVNTFAKLSLTNINNIYVASKSTMALTSTGIFSWGDNTDGMYGNWSSDSSDTPRSADPFGTVSVLSQSTKDISNVYASSAANEMYVDDALVEAVFKSYVDTSTFPPGTRFSLKSPPVVTKNGTIELNVIPDRTFTSPDGLYAPGQLTPSLMKITLLNFKSAVDTSTISYITPLPTDYNLNNIKDKIAPSGILDYAILSQLIDVTEFPVGTNFTITGATTKVNADNLTGTYTATLGVDKHYEIGSISGAKTYNISIGNLAVRNDSVITALPVDYNKFNLNNIRRALDPSGNGTLDEGNFLLLFAPKNFGGTNTFSIKNINISGTNYSATISATEAYVGGNITAKDFPIVITGLKAQPDSVVNEKTPPAEEIDKIISALKPGSTVKNDILGKLIDLDKFPPGTIFMIDSVTTDKQKSTVTFKFTPDKIYKDGNAVTNTGAGKKDFTATVKFKTALSIDKNTWIYVGLTTGIAVILILIALLIVYAKNRWNNDDYIHIKD